MAQEQKYGNPEIEGIPADEPVFIIRGQDVAAVPTIVAYRGICANLGSPGEHLLDCDKVAATVQAWQAQQAAEGNAPKVAD